MEKPVAVLEIHDEVNVRLRRVDAATMNHMSRTLAFMAKNARHTPSFKLGRWDGRIRLLDAGTGYTYLNLIDDILPDLESRYQIEIVDKRIDYSVLVDQIEFVAEDMFSEYKWPAGHPSAGESIRLRDYQIEAANACISAGSGVVELGTSGGKSLMCAALAQRYSTVGNVVVIVPTTDLVIQTRGTFRTVGIDCGIWFGPEKDRRTVTMCTWQSLDNFRELFDGVYTFIVDECQGAKAKILADTLSSDGANVPFRFGCTGTLPDDDLSRKQILSVVGPSVYKKTIKEMQDAGYLSQGEIEQIEFDDKANPDYPRMVVKDGATGKYKTVWGHSEYLDEIAWMHSQPARMKVLTDLIRGFSEQGKTLVLVQHYDFHDKLMEALPHAISITGTISPTKRTPLWDRFRGDENLAIVTSGVGAVGIDVTTIRYVIGIEMGKSLIKVLQTLGRGLRKGSGKDWIDFIDICGTAKMSQRHANERKQIFEAAGQKVIRTKVDYI